MADASVTWGGDLNVSATGDILLADEMELNTQRIIRRLLTNSGDYIWQPRFGAGLGAFVGQPENALEIEAIILRQLRMESSVVQNPPPSVSVSFKQNGQVFADVKYLFGPTNIPKSFSVSIGA